MTTIQELQQLRLETRDTRKRIAMIERSWEQQKEKSQLLEQRNKLLEKKVNKLKQKNNILEKLIKELKDQLNQSDGHKDSLINLIFKPNKKSNNDDNVSARSRGAIIGHAGYGRKKSSRVDQTKYIHLSHCPCCNNKLNQSSSYHIRTIEDIPLPQATITTRYHIQRQWCGKCQKEVRGSPPGSLPGFRIGLNLISWLMVQKYSLRLPLNLISQSLKEQYECSLTTGAIQNTFHRLKHQFTDQYQQILAKIQRGRVKHADETGWRVNGQNNWCWLITNDKSAYYTITESRSKGVAKELIGKISKGILVRDDYRAYQKLPLQQQSCWAHLLRKSHELSNSDNASDTVKVLHLELKKMFNEIQTIIDKPFKQKQRKKEYDQYLNKIRLIINRRYNDQDSQKIQTRIRNQEKNLITAIINPNVPLTNNKAERQIRPMVVTRKISGGSQSKAGAQTHAVNMTIMQTLKLEGKNLFTGLRELLDGDGKYVLERTE